MKPAAKSGAGFGQVLLVLIGAALLVLSMALLVSCLGNAGATSTTRATATPFPTRVIHSIEDLEEDISGGWRADDGREIVLNQDGTFISFPDDGDPLTGGWYTTETELCLVAATFEQCHNYNQYSNVLRVGEAVYYRY